MVTDAESSFDHLQNTGSIPKERQTIIDLLVIKYLGGELSGTDTVRAAHDRRVQLVLGKWRTCAAPVYQGGCTRGTSKTPRKQQGSPQGGKKKMLQASGLLVPR